MAALNCGQRDRLDLDTLRLDQRERLFCTGERYGEVMFADATRFSILRHANRKLRRGSDRWEVACTALAGWRIVAAKIQEALPR